MPTFRLPDWLTTVVLTLTVSEPKTSVIVPAALVDVDVTPATLKLLGIS